MHLLFYGKLQEKVLDMDWLQNILKDLSIRQGQIYDNPASVSGIASFVATYDLPLDDLLEPDVTKYKCFNEFFYRLVFFSICLQTSYYSLQQTQARRTAYPKS
jgi:phosphatidylserine decarboxylase